MSRPTIPVAVAAVDDDVGEAHPGREKSDQYELCPRVSSESMLDSSSQITLQEPVVSSPQ
jgi:hypothetical protein